MSQTGFSRVETTASAGRRPLVVNDREQQHERRHIQHTRGVVGQPLIWIAVALMLTGAVMLVVDVGAAALWIAVITIGIALVALDGYRHRHGQHHA
jgi:hypothetical protein